jgi:glycosyltransferase 2 family protein
MPAPRPSRPLVAILPTLLALALLAFAGRWFALRWQAVMGTAERPAIAWGWLGLAAFLLMVHASTAMVIWRQVLAAVGARLTWRETLDSFAPSLLARYVPGKVWANAVRLGLARRAGVRLGASAGAILWETQVALGTGGLVAFVGLSIAGEAQARTAGWLVLGVLAAWVVAAVVARRASGAALIERFGGAGPVREPAVLLPAVLTSVLGWVLFSLAHLAVVRAVAPVGLDALPVVAGAVALAWAGGYLAIVMPLGLGVRDGLLLVLLAGTLTPAPALLFVALSRLVQLAVDATITGGWLVRQLGRGGAAGAAPR